MLTTSEQFNRKLSATVNSVYSNNIQNSFNKINFNKLFQNVKLPASYMLSLYSNTSLAEEIKKSNVKPT